MARSFKSIQEVVDAKLCSGCGACRYMQPDDIRMENVLDEGLRPITRAFADTTDAVNVCPGIHLEHAELRPCGAIDRALLDAWGPILAIWEGGASDDALRFAGSSGGAASALAVHALENLGFELVLHVGADPKAPYLNETVASRTRDELLSRTGSRYAPASPCERLAVIEEADGPCLFIGKPCDVAAAQKARKRRPKLDENLAVTVAFFCAGTPSTNGTLALLRKLGMSDVSDLGSLRYRGNGWPGRFKAETHDGDASYSCSYEESWGEVLTNHVQWRCRLCIDHTGEFADVAVGDPWYREIREGEAGSSLIVARTPLGERFVRDALGRGALAASPVDLELLPRSQPNLLQTRGEVWGRMVGSRLVGARTPTYRRLPSFRFWMSEVPLERKVRSIVGAARRCVRKGIAFKTVF